MKCQTCEQDFQDTAVKVWNGIKVCPSCFVTLTRDTLPENRTVTHHIDEVRYHTPTTVCPKCNAEIHVDTRTCPRCGVLVRQSDRVIEAAAAATAEVTKSVVRQFTVTNKGMLEVVYILLFLLVIFLLICFLPQIFLFIG